MTESKNNFYFFDLPVELQEIILKFINTEKGVLTARRVCANWYHFLSNVPVFCEGVIIGKNTFSLNSFQYQDMDDNIISIIEFGPYGQWKYTQYSPSGFVIRTIKNKKIFQTQMTDNSHPQHNRVLTCDSRYGIIKESRIPKLIHPGNCVIS